MVTYLEYMIIVANFNHLKKKTFESVISNI